jgi:hypothetical protein
LDRHRGADSIRRGGERGLDAVTGESGDRAAVRFDDRRQRVMVCAQQVGAVVAQIATAAPSNPPCR